MKGPYKNQFNDYLNGILQEQEAQLAVTIIILKIHKIGVTTYWLSKLVWWLKSFKIEFSQNQTSCKKIILLKKVSIFKNLR